MRFKSQERTEYRVQSEWFYNSQVFSTLLSKINLYSELCTLRLIAIND